MPDDPIEEEEIEFAAETADTDPNAAPTPGAETPPPTDPAVPTQDGETPTTDPAVPTQDGGTPPTPTP